MVYFSASFQDDWYKLNGIKLNSTYSPPDEAYKLLSCFDYYIGAGRTRLNKTVKTDYFNTSTSTDSLVSTIQYYYENPVHAQVTQTDIKRSDGKIKKVLTSYPADIETGVYESMVDSNMHNYPIEQVMSLNDTVIGSQLTMYKPNGYSYVPDKVNAIEMISPLTSFTYFNGTTKDSHYSSTPEIEFIDYNTAGKLVKAKDKNGLHNYYVWAYNNHYPVARIESNTNTTISVSVNDNNLSKSDDLINIRNDVSYLKGLLASYINNDDYMVTLYTYKPLIGMTSETDPNGVTTYYEYDSFGRLKCTKDDDDNILKQYEYHYSNQ